MLDRLYAKANGIDACCGRVYLGLACCLASLPLSPHRVFSFAVARISGCVEMRLQLDGGRVCLSLGVLDRALTLGDFFPGLCDCGVLKYVEELPR